MLGDDDDAPSISVTVIPPPCVRDHHNQHRYQSSKVADGSLLLNTRLLVLAGNRCPSGYSEFCVIEAYAQRLKMAAFCDARKLGE
jgi:hypothetical protein